MKLLVFAHTPPPHHGQSYMVKLMLDRFGGDVRIGGKSETRNSKACLERSEAESRGSEIECYHVNCRYSDNLEDIGSFRIEKAWLVLRYSIEAIWCRFRYGVRAFYYVPAPGRRRGLYRDWIVMLLCRPFFPYLVHHWEEAGLGDWLETEGSALERWLTRSLLGKPTLGIVPSLRGMRDPLWFLSRSAEVVPPSIADPCPDYGQVVQPLRERRTAARRALFTGKIRARSATEDEAVESATVELLVLAQDSVELNAILQAIVLLLAELEAGGAAPHCRARILTLDAPAGTALEIETPLPPGIAVETIGSDSWSGAAARATIWRESDCLLLAGGNSPWATSLVLEAMAFGVPVIVDGRAAAADLLPADYVGKLWGCRPGEFADAMLAVWTEVATPLRENFLARHAPGPYVEQFRAALGRLTEIPARVAFPPALPAQEERATATILQIFNRYLEVGGEEKSVERIAQDMAAGGNEVVRFLRESAEWHASTAPPRWKHPFLLWRNPAILEELRALHREAGATCWVVHNYLPVISLELYHEAGRLGVPLIQFLHNYRPLSPSGSLFAGGHRLQPEDRWIAWKETFFGSWRGNRLLTAWLALGYWWIKIRGDLRHVSAWVAVSEEMRQVFLRAGWPAEKTFTLRHAWHPNPNDVEPGPDEGFFLFLGRVVESKGVRFLIELWRSPELAHLQLVMAGEGDLVAELTACSPPNVRWIGFVSGAEKQHWLARCRAVLFPSLWDEPLSTVAYEAYEHRRPILASSQGGMKEIVFDHSTGRLLPPGDDAAWLEAIRTLDAETAVRLGAEGRRWLLTHTGPEAWAQQFNEILAKVLPPARGTKNVNDDHREQR